jgi:hypothetical protein
VNQGDLFLVDRGGDFIKKVERQDNIDMPVITGLRCPNEHSADQADFYFLGDC